MAETSGSGGVGALSIAGIATVVVIIGGVLLTQLGVFDSTDEVVDTQVAAEQTEEPGNANPAEETVDLLPSSSAPVTAPSISPSVTTENEEGVVDTPEVAIEDTVVDSDVPVSSDASDAELGDTPATSDTAEFASTLSEDTQVSEENSPNKAQQSGADAIADVPAENDAANNVREPEAPDGAPSSENDEVAESVAPPETPTAEQVAQEVVPLLAPEIDVIRFDPDGAGLIAGRALAGSRVLIMLDGDVIEEVATSGSGEFVAFPAVDPSAEPRVVTIATQADDEIATSDVSFILAPVTPIAVAENEIAPEVTDTQTEIVDAEPVADTQPIVGSAAVDVAAQDPENPAQAAGHVAPEVAENVPDSDASTDVPNVAAPEAEDTNVRQELAHLQTQPQAAAPVPTPDTPEPEDGTVAPQEQAVPKPKAPAIAVLRAGPDGVEVVQPVAPSTPELADKVALDAISYTPTGNVILTGRARPAALVRVYIDNSPVVDVRTNVNGRWRTGLDSVAPGIYTLRLDEIDHLEGKVLSRLETPFKREAPEVLVQPAPEVGDPQVDTTIRAVTVQQGDTLWAISQASYGDGFLFLRVFEANKEAIRNPDLIYPGQIFTLPE